MKLLLNTNAHHGDPFPIIVTQISLWPISSARWSTGAIWGISFFPGCHLNHPLSYLHCRYLWQIDWPRSLSLWHSGWQVVYRPLRDLGLGNAGVQQHCQLPGQCQGGKDWGDRHMLIIHDDVMLNMLIGWYNNIDSVRVVQMEVTWWYENSFPHFN